MLSLQNRFRDAHLLQMELLIPSKLEFREGGFIRWLKGLNANVLAQSWGTCPSV